MWTFYAGLAGLLLSSVYLVWKVQAEYTSRQNLAQSTAAAVWIWYVLHAALTAYVAWRSIWPLALNRLLAIVAGSLLSIAGLTVAAAGILHLRSLQRMSGRATDELVTSGIYGWSRNPQNVGWFLVLLGVSVIGRSAGAIVLLALFALTLHFYIVYVEEPYLEEVFGDAYRRYRSTTPRCLGLPKERRDHG
jgi:protein-S-isoprenylcysteine O-methyltransferase Ste14